ncbi:MAG: hypothetical protein EOO52_12300 [Gammaproteobacteria bacterium]|nr:MAG: hypothetical protein EOO52_12300 [Gammaproteobacteria bacterium]
MKTLTVGRLLLSRSFILGCQIASLVAVVFLVFDILDASDLSAETKNKVQSHYELFGLLLGGMETNI